MKKTVPPIPLAHIPEGFTKWHRNEDGWVMSVGDYIAVVEFMPEDALFVCKVNSAAHSAEKGFLALEDALQYGEEEILDDAAETIRRVGEARVARFIERGDIYPELIPVEDGGNG